MPKVSIIIPTLNSATTIERCLESIRVQTFKDYEILLQDGGSSDATVELAEEFRRQNPEVAFKLKREPDNGIYDAMNKAVKLAKGEWLQFLGSDDELYDQDALWKVFASQEAADCDVLYGNVQFVGSVGSSPDGTIYDGPFDLKKLLTVNICHQSMFYRSAFLRDVGYYNTRYKVVADWDLNMRCWSKGRFKYMDVVVAKYYSGGLSSFNPPDRHFDAEVTKNALRYFNLSPSDPLIDRPSFCGRTRGGARQAPRMTPMRVVRGLARRLGLTASSKN